MFVVGSSSVLHGEAQRLHGNWIQVLWLHSCPTLGGALDTSVQLPRAFEASSRNIPFRRVDPLRVVWSSVACMCVYVCVSVENVVVQIEKCVCLICMHLYAVA